MQNDTDTDSRSFATSPMLVSLKDRNTILATFVNNHASDSQEYNRPRFSKHVVAMMYCCNDVSMLRSTASHILVRLLYCLLTFEMEQQCMSLVA